jgi:hypothetical protein
MKTKHGKQLRQSIFPSMSGWRLAPTQASVSCHHRWWTITAGG